MHGGRQQVSTENPRRDNWAPAFLENHDNTNTRQTGEKKIHTTLSPYVVRSRKADTAAAVGPRE